MKKEKYRRLKIGEIIKIRDYCCDSRTQPVQVVTNEKIKITENHHPFYRKVKS